MENTYADLSARRNRVVSSDNRPSYAETSIDLLMYRWQLGKVDAALDLLNSVEIMKMLDDPAEYILESLIDRLQVMAEYSLRMMEGVNNGQRESDHN